MMSHNPLGYMLPEASELCANIFLDTETVEPEESSANSNSVPGPTAYLNTSNVGIGFFEGKSFHQLETFEHLPKSVNKNESESKSEPPMEKPKRSLTAYNIFFRHERQKILNSTPEDTPLTVESIDIDSSRRRKKRRHHKTHGKIGFFDLTRVIADKWKNLDDKSRSIFEACAQKDKQRHKEEMKKWLEQKKSAEDAQETLEHDKGSTSFAPVAPQINHHEYLHLAQETMKMADAALSLPLFSPPGSSDSGASRDNIGASEDQLNRLLHQNHLQVKHLQKQLKLQKLLQHQPNQVPLVAPVATPEEFTVHHPSSGVPRAHHPHFLHNTMASSMTASILQGELHNGSLGPQAIYSVVDEQSVPTKGAKPVWDQPSDDKRSPPPRRNSLNALSA